MILQAKAQNRLAQKALYENYSSKMLSVCRYYIHDVHFAEDVMLKAFFKAFNNIQNFDQESSFYTWLKSIVTHECIDFLRSKTHKLDFAAWDEILESSSDEIGQNYDLKALQQMIDTLPDGCKIVFNLYVLEGFKHQEIADELNISVGTSKSQLAYARKNLQQMLKKINYHV